MMGLAVGSGYGRWEGRGQDSPGIRCKSLPEASADVVAEHEGR